MIGGTSSELTDRKFVQFMEWCKLGVLTISWCCAIKHGDHLSFWVNGSRPWSHHCL